MNEFGEILKNMMRTIANALNYPVIFLLLVLAGISVILVGTIVVEGITEHRKLKVNMPTLMESLRKAPEQLNQLIMGSGLLKSQKDVLLEIASHPDFTADMRTALATRLIEQETERFQKRVLWSDLISKLGPMFGLLGTLIPLGPGIIALGGGDTYTLSQSLMNAFDTTILGLSSAAVAMVISTIRKRWYAGYMATLSALAECVLEVTENGTTSK